jgi:hypothetical protein
VEEPVLSRRDQATAELREAVSGREDEFAGIGFILVGVLLGLGIYFDLAGPLGRGVETLVGWFTGLGRFIVPIALVGIGIALVRKGRSGHRFRLGIGWGLASLAILGLLHVVHGPKKIMSDFDTLGRAGGWLGALVAEPLRGLLASGGAIVGPGGGVPRCGPAHHGRLGAHVVRPGGARRGCSGPTDGAQGAPGVRRHGHAEERP